MDFILGILSIVIISALVVDWLLTDKKFTVQLRKNWRNNNKSHELQFESSVHETSKFFCLIFDSVYGTKTWSWKRFYRSTILSFLFIIFSIVIIGINNTFIGDFDVRHSDQLNDLIFTFLILFGLNTIIDFFSLQETRLVLRWVSSSKNGKFSHVFALMFVDLVLTSLVFVIFVLTALILISIVAGHPFDLGQVMIIVGSFLTELLIDEAMLLPFFISTFGTSIVWLAFVFFTFLAKFLGTIPMFALILKAISETTSPARVVAVIFTIPLAFVSIFFQLFIKSS